MQDDNGSISGVVLQPGGFSAGGVYHPDCGTTITKRHESTELRMRHSDPLHTPTPFCHCDGEHRAPQ